MCFCCCENNRILDNEETSKIENKVSNLNEKYLKELNNQQQKKRPFFKYWSRP